MSTSSKVVTEEKRGVGAIMHVTSELFRLPIVKDVMAITAWEPPRRMDVEHRGQFKGTGQFLLEPAHNGTTFIWIEDFAPPLRPLSASSCSRSSCARTCAASSRGRWRMCGGWRKRALVETKSPA